MGDTENGSWNSDQLGGYIRREEARKEWEQAHAKDRADELEDQATEDSPETPEEEEQLIEPEGGDKT